MNQKTATSLQLAVLDALPSMVFIVDKDLRILQRNQAAASLVGGSGADWLQLRTGDLLHCLNSMDRPEGCGKGPRCGQCPMRLSVEEAAGGGRVVRRRMRLLLHQGETVQEIYALVTTTPFPHQGDNLILLVLEDIGDLAEIRHFLSICCVCKKVRDEADGWMRIESYFKNYWDVDFTHGYCPDCLADEKNRMLKDCQAIGRGWHAPNSPDGDPPTMDRHS